MVILSNRLKQIAERVPAGSKLADIGSDHALLPVYLVQSGAIPAAIAGEVNPGPYAAAMQQVRDAGLTAAIQVRRGDGLSVLQPDEVETITIAGMGGSLIVKILSAGEDKLGVVKRLVLQPNVGEEFVRRYLVEKEWLLTEEAILEEDGKIYEILVAERNNDVQRKNERLYDANPSMLLKMGPFLLQEASPVFVQKWHGEIAKLERISEQLDESELAASKAKKQELDREIQTLKEVLLACTQKDKPSFS
ncbi:tRNA (adenine(22)-N(1))-methyltransferase [Gorillibacterium massiliense]|uniref:tRNA (adenine(22)-N(1))-methyltransferase n=1 Tax=Gorillibacterium massiliense TaxID=1280390 RepID=UPI0004B00689|nr:tRNA (adenine(22)-N(1))-methyltransferase TrmK [Gorillibacterium massiliense]